MSGHEDEEGVDGQDWYWAHILWQKRGIRLEDFAEMPRNVKLAYIASEQLASESPLNPKDRLARAYLTQGRG